MSRNKMLLTLIITVSTVILIQQRRLSAQPEGHTFTDHGIVGSWVVIPSAPNRPAGLPNAFTFTADGARGDIGKSRI